MPVKHSIERKSRVLIVDDKAENYKKLRSYLEKENFIVEKRIDTEDQLREYLQRAKSEKNWYEFVMIDIDLKRSGEISNGIQIYLSVLHDFPEETYIIYSSQDIDQFRKDINRLMYHRHVELLLLDEVLGRMNMRFHLSRLIQKVPPNRVFIIHGRNHNKLKKIRKLLTAGFGLDIVEWEDALRNSQSQRDYIFDTVLSGIQMSHVTIALFTDDEIVELRKKFRIFDDIDGTLKRIKRRQSRPNVYIEAGYAMGVRPQRTIFVAWPDREKYFVSPSNFQGIHVLRFDDVPEARQALKDRLENARCRLSMARNWKTMSLLGS